ncbi:Aldo/keto reductase [uncultured virus]|nr:Aldo/keto reductase [uncultured virus]
MALIFGLYPVTHDDVARRISFAHKLGLTRFDTAQIYGNERACAEACNETDTITTKIYACNIAGQVDKLVKRSINRFSRSKTIKDPPSTFIPKKIDTMLLHRPMPNECWGALCVHADKFNNIGISNYDFNGLKDLLSYCENFSLKKPDVHQMEVHPFVDCEHLIEYCKSQGIRVQGHTILGQGKFFKYLPLQVLSRKYKVSPSVILTVWALSKGIDICVATSSEEHLAELQTATKLVLDDEDLIDINNWHSITPHRFYGKINKVPLSLNGIPNQEEYITQVVAQLKKDQKSAYPSDICDHLPLAGEPYRSVGRTIAAMFFPELKPEAALNKYRMSVKELRQKRIQQRKVNFLHKKGLSCCVVRRTTGPYSDSIIQPKPMPVDVTDPSEFKPFFSYLTSSEALPQSDTIFVRGAIFPDGRMDLCKQVVGPRSIRELCDTVKNSKIVRHFLLGNNVALQDNEELGAEALASVMRDNSKPIETWYLAGNCVGPKATKIIADALTTNTQCKALWLKRNPVGSFGAQHLNSMLRLNETLVLLDLHNCGLGDEGVSDLLAAPDELKSLKHLYLDANGFESATSIAKWAAIAHPVTLYLSINRLGDTAIIELLSALHGSPRLKRLCLASTHMRNPGLKAVVDMALTCPRLFCLNLGCYKSTADMGEHPGNFFDDDAIPDLVRLMTECNTLQYLNIAGCKISEKGLLSLPRMPNISMDLGKGPWHHVHEKDTLRFVKQPKRVAHIDSIYRGKF